MRKRMTCFHELTRGVVLLSRSLFQLFRSRYHVVSSVIYDIQCTWSLWSNIVVLRKCGKCNPITGLPTVLWHGWFTMTTFRLLISLLGFRCFHDYCYATCCYSCPCRSCCGTVRAEQVSWFRYLLKTINCDWQEDEWFRPVLCWATCKRHDNIWFALLISLPNQHDKK